MDKWLKYILPDKDPYHNRGRDQMRKKGVGSGIRVPVEETGVPGENQRTTAIHCQTLSHYVVSSTPRFKLSTLEVIGTDFTGSCKSNYHTITTATISQTLTEI